MIAKTQQKPVFKRIALGAIRNMAGFGLAVWGTAYLATLPDMRKPALLAAAIVLLIMLTTLNALLLFTFYTLRSIPSTLQEKAADMSFQDIYGYTLAAISIRLLESVVYVYYIVYLYHVLFV